MFLSGVGKAQQKRTFFLSKLSSSRSEESTTFPSTSLFERSFLYVKREKQTSRNESFRSKMRDSKVNNDFFLSKKMKYFPNEFSIQNSFTQYDHTRRTKVRHRKCWHIHFGCAYRRKDSRQVARWNELFCWRQKPSQHNDWKIEKSIQDSHDSHVFRKGRLASCVISVLER